MGFTPATAALQAVKGHAARKQRKIEHAQMVAIMGDQLPYVAAQVADVRAHIDRLSSLLRDSTDPQTIERLSRAMAVMSERERVLAGRPLPGARRPDKEKLALKRPGLLCLPVEAPALSGQ